MSAPLDVGAIRARAEAATPGPWKHVPGLMYKHYVASTDPGEDLGLSLQVFHPQDGREVPAEKNARFIAHARADVPALCDALEHERRVSAAWKALAHAGRYTNPAGVLQAETELRELGEDPEAP